MRPPLLVTLFHLLTADALVHVDLQQTHLTLVPFDIYPNVTILDLSANAIPDIPVFPVLPSLTSLLIADNLLMEFPNLVNVSQIVTLDLARNRMSVIDPLRLNALGNLGHLSLSGNLLSSVPTLPPRVQDFRLQENLFTACPPAGIIPPGAILASLEKNDLVACPSDWLASTSVYKVALTYNHLDAIPDFRPVKDTLRRLYLGHNDITHVRAHDVRYLGQLLELHLLGNPLQHVPDVLVMPPALLVLGLDWVFTMPCDYTRMKWINAVRDAEVMTVETSGDFRFCFQSDENKVNFQGGTVISYESFVPETRRGNNQLSQMRPAPTELTLYPAALRPIPEYTALQCVRECIRLPTCLSLYWGNDLGCVLTDASRLSRDQNITASGTTFFMMD